MLLLLQASVECKRAAPDITLEVSLMLRDGHIRVHNNFCEILNDDRKQLAMHLGV